MVTSGKQNRFPILEKQFLFSKLAEVVPVNPPNDFLEGSQLVQALCSLQEALVQPTTSRQTLDPRARPAVYLGIDPETRTILAGTLDQNLRTTAVVSATFVEGVFPFRALSKENELLGNSILWGTATAPPLDGNLQQTPVKETEQKERRELIRLGATPTQKVPVILPQQEERESSFPQNLRSEASSKRPKRVIVPSVDWLRHKPDVDAALPFLLQAVETQDKVVKTLKLVVKVKPSQASA